MVFNNDFETLGFLADLPDDRAARKARFQAEFDTGYKVAHEATRLAKFLLTRHMAAQHQHVTAALWFRCAGAAQGAVLLAERGMPVEAAALARSSLEYLFWGVALIKDAGVLQRLADNERDSVKKAANGMLGLKDVVAELGAEELELLREKAAGEAVTNTSVAKAAELAELGYLYQSAYRGLSRWGVHAGMATASVSVQDNRLEFAPTDFFIEQVLRAIEQGVGRVGLKHFGDFANALPKASA